jgi:MOSC domain-containing protein YiiM
MSTPLTIESLQVGHVISEGDATTDDPLLRQWTTGFYKQPVHPPDRLVSLTRMGLVGDAVADTRNHGGVDKAVLCYAAAHYPLWMQEHPDLAWKPGALGENLTLSGTDETSVCIGDRFAVGDCEVQVSQPRQPCWKISRRWGLKTLTKEVAQTGRTGWYLRVLREGTIARGMSFQLLDRPNPSWPVARANDVLFGREVDRLSVMELMNLQELAEAWRKDIA